MIHSICRILPAPQYVWFVVHCPRYLTTAICVPPMGHKSHLGELRQCGLPKVGGFRRVLQFPTTDNVFAAIV